MKCVKLSQYVGKAKEAFNWKFFKRKLSKHEIIRRFSESINDNQYDDLIHGYRVPLKQGTEIQMEII